MPKNILLYTHMPSFETSDGTLGQYEFAKTLKEMGENIKIYPLSGVFCENHIFNDFYNNNFSIDDETIVIYCEGTQGNPLNAKKVVRWMLSEIGQNVPYEYIHSWGKNELVYYFNSESKFEKTPEKMNSIYKLLNVFHINTAIKKYNFDKRDGVCYTLRKSSWIHNNNNKNVLFFHPKKSFEITREHTFEECVNIFNNHKWFISYDPLSFYIVVAGLCGCIPVIKKIDGVSKQEWIKKTAAAEYIKHKNLDNLYGIAYGQEDMQYAVETIHLMQDQWEDIVNFSKTNTIEPFLKDLDNFEENINTIQNNYFLIDKSFGFIITRHVNSEKTNQYWNQNVKLLQKYYPDRKIVIIDDDSNQDLVKADLEYENVEIINSEYKGRGELLPYIYFARNDWFDNAFVIHDEVFFHQRIHIDSLKDIKAMSLWFFHNNNNSELSNILRVASSLENNEKVLEKIHEWDQNTWLNCFGVMSYINRDFLLDLDNKYKLNNLIDVVKNCSDRCALEHLFGVLFYLETNQSRDTMFGCINETHAMAEDYSYTFDKYFDDYKNNNLPCDVVKVWTER